MLNPRDRECGHVRTIARLEFLLRAAHWCVAIAGVSLIACGAYGIYGIWRNKHLEAQAQTFATRGDVQSAVLVARHLLQIDKNNLVATRVIAQLADQSGRPEAIEWRKGVAAAEPKNPENYLALASTALRFGQIDLAARALDSIDTSFRDTVRVHQLAGTIALAQHKPELAEQHFAAAHEQDTENHQIALNLATTRLASSKPQTTEIAREHLVQLSAQSDVRTAALRALAADAIARHDHTNADRWTAALVQERSAPFADFLLRLEATYQTDNSATVMTECQRRARANSANAVELITWMNRHDLAAAALEWSGSLDQKVAETQPVPLAIAESLSYTHDWRTLARFVQDTRWGAQESLRLAVQSHAVRHLGDSDSAAEAATLWRAATKAAQPHPDQLAMIARLAEGWGYRAEAGDVLWQIASGAVGAKEALTALQRIYKQTNDTHGLLRIAKRALELNPDDLVAANSCANLGLLLNSDATARRLAEKLYKEHPTNAAFAATYAFALHISGKTADALRVIERLKEQQLRQPALAAYYVMMLAANGELERARAFLPAAEHANLLPEEQTLLAEAARKLVSGS